MNKTTFRLALCLLMVAIVVSGCGGKKKPDGFPTLYPCEIKIIQDGVPLEGAVVNLFSEDGSVKWVVGNGTDANGVAKMYTHGDFQGAPTGKYKVTVTKTVIEDAPSQEQLNNPNFVGPMGTAYDYVELEYKSQKTTPLSMEVTSGKNSQEFDVGKAIRDKVRIR